MHEYLSEPTSGLAVEHEELTIKQQGPANLIVDKPFYIKRQGYTHKRTFKVPCITCNNGWMSRLETLVKVFLVPMLTNQTIVLNRLDQLNLAKWVILKAMIAEQNHAENCLYTSDDYKSFKNDLTIPKNTYIAIGQLVESVYGAAYLRKTAQVSASPLLRPPGNRPNIQTITFNASRIVIQLQTLPTYVADKFPEQSDFGALFYIWPFQREFSWPPAFNMTPAQAGNVARILDKLFASPGVGHLPRR